MALAGTVIVVFGFLLNIGGRDFLLRPTDARFFAHPFTLFAILMLGLAVGSARDRRPSAAVSVLMVIAVALCGLRVVETLLSGPVPPVRLLQASFEEWLGIDRRMGIDTAMVCGLLLLAQMLMRCCPRLTLLLLLGALEVLVLSALRSGLGVPIFAASMPVPTLLALVLIQAASVAKVAHWPALRLLFKAAPLSGRIRRILAAFALSAAAVGGVMFLKIEIVHSPEQAGWIATVILALVTSTFLSAAFVIQLGVDTDRAIATQRRLELQLWEEANRDALTGLFNRRAGMRRIARQFDLWRDGGAALDLMMVDLDHFKAINDTLGHEAGDDVLRAVAVSLRAALRREDAVFRWGGEEFLVLLAPGCAEEHLAVAERLRRRIAALSIPRDGEGRTSSVTASIGLARVRFDDPRPETLIARADAALYVAKKSGRDQVVTDDSPEVAEALASTGTPAGTMPQMPGSRQVLITPGNALTT